VKTPTSSPPGSFLDGFRSRAASPCRAPTTTGDAHRGPQRPPASVPDARLSAAGFAHLLELYMLYSGAY
jgi:hypothetical protein